MAEDNKSKNRRVHELMDSSARAKLLYAGEQHYDQCTIFLHPDMISMVANVPEDEGNDYSISLHKKLGTIIHGPVALITNLKNIRVGPKSHLNPLLETQMHSMAVTPIPVLWPAPSFAPSVSQLISDVNGGIEVPPQQQAASSASPQVFNSSTSMGNTLNNMINRGNQIMNEATNPQQVDNPTAPQGSQECIDKFKQKVTEMCGRLGIQPDWLYKVMWVESGINASAKNPSSSASGLIQFMESTASAMGTTTATLRSMTAVQQLDYVEKYFNHYKGRMKDVGDVYAAVFWPAAVGKSVDTVLCSSPSSAYNLNRGFDQAKRGYIVKQDLIDAVNRKGTPKFNKVTC